MLIKLRKEAYILAKSIDFSELGNHIRFIDSDNSIELDDGSIVLRDYFDNEYEDLPIWVMLECISDEVATTGLSADQNEVLPRGRELYALYDSIYYNLPASDKIKPITPIQ